MGIALLPQNMWKRKVSFIHLSRTFYDSKNSPFNSLSRERAEKKNQRTKTVPFATHHPIFK
jgi:hypothetical protein